ncbi:hypothetical protein ATN84_01520 [Paramesorhizobium deserti]|uniref:Uncharacterized protein n=1 Tax=Paramesorhizobium deserti TaxID=1494590 RepID=A0A135HZ75_9HYPH|nr:hypothetical protein [Paramesorhizobium deserti]KXF78502.1 hypothetical protein ATN84_01520 [Paramesorhizobium deserti]
MGRLVRIFAILLLAMFATGTIAHAAQTAGMSATMSAAVMAKMDMVDCEGCPKDHGKAPVCEQGCLMPFAGITAAAGIRLPVLASDRADFLLIETDGDASPPDLAPPRSSITR